MTRSKISPILVGISILVMVGYLFSVQDRLPDTVATHWGTSGAADGFTSKGALPYLFGGLAVLVGGIMSILAVRAPGRAVAGVRLILGMPMAIVWFIGALAVITVNFQLDGGSSSSLPGYAIPLALAIGVVGWAFGAVVAGKPDPIPSTSTAASANAARHPLAAGETAVWSGRTPSSMAMPIAVIVILVLAVLLGAAASWWIVVVLGPVALFVMASLSYNVTVGRSGVRVAGMGIGLPRVQIPMDQIAGVEVGTVRARDYGGWGIRLGTDTAILTRSGPALIVNRTDGAALRVSLDNPEEPAAVLASLMDRRA